MEAFASAVDVAAAIRRREVSPVEVLDACLGLVDKLNPSLNAVIWRNDEDGRAEAQALADALVTGAVEPGPFAGVPIPIKDLTPVEGWPVTYGSFGAPLGPSRRWRARHRVAAGRRLRPVREDQHPRVRSPDGGRELPLRHHPQPVGSPLLARRFERRGGGGRGSRDVPRGPRQRRRWFDQDPGVVLRTGGSEAQPGPGSGPVPGLVRHGGGRRGVPDRPRRRRHPRLHQRARPALLGERPRPRASLRRRGGSGARSAAFRPLLHLSSRPPGGRGAPGRGAKRPAFSSRASATRWRSSRATSSTRPPSAPS